MEAIKKEMKWNKMKSYRWLRRLLWMRSKIAWFLLCHVRPSLGIPWAVWTQASVDRMPFFPLWKLTAGSVFTFKISHTNEELAHYTPLYSQHIDYALNAERQYECFKLTGTKRRKQCLLVCACKNVISFYLYSWIPHLYRKPIGY